MINESGTMTGGGGKARGGRICLGNAPPRPVDTKMAEAELAQAEAELQSSLQVRDCHALPLLQLCPAMKRTKLSDPVAR